MVRGRGGWSSVVCLVWVLMGGVDGSPTDSRRALDVAVVPVVSGSLMPQKRSMHGGSKSHDSHWRIEPFTLASLSAQILLSALVPVAEAGGAQSRLEMQGWGRA